jgi:hypothetical protein
MADCPSAAWTTPQGSDVTVAFAAATPEPTAASWLSGDHLVAAGTVVAALLAAIVAIATYRAERRLARAERLAATFAHAIQAVEDYLESPYRIRRRPARDAQIRFALTSHISEIQSRIAFHQAWMAVDAGSVAVQYQRLVEAAHVEAGAQMSDAWRGPATRADKEVPLGVRLPHPLSTEAKTACLTAMRIELNRTRSFWHLG